MSDKIDGLTGVVGKIDELNRHAERIAGELSQNIDGLKQALEHTDAVNKKLGTASANLRRALGTNFPPVAPQQK
jgi:ABC-type transporter Mla subunit MlaD